MQASYCECKGFQCSKEYALSICIEYVSLKIPKGLARCSSSAGLTSCSRTWTKVCAVIKWLPPPLVMIIDSPLFSSLYFTISLCLAHPSGIVNAIGPLVPSDQDDVSTLDVKMLEMRNNQEIETIPSSPSIAMKTIQCIKQL